MRLTPLFLIVALGLSASAPRLAQDFGAQYHALFSANDFDGLVALWKTKEARVLGTIDSDLEGSLALWEAAQTGAEEVPPTAEVQAQIAELHRRALFGARAASEAFGRPIFLDYAASFVSWDTAQKRHFRAGQQAFGEARGAMRAEQPDFEAAVAAAERCTTLALPLGDWWGTAMGLGGSGQAKLALGRTEEALGDLSQARLLNQALGLASSEIGNLQGMLECLQQLESWPRARVVCEALLAALGEKAPKELRELQAELATK